MKYECNSYIDKYEYGKMAPYFVKKFYLGFVLYGTVYNLLLCLIIFVLTKNKVDGLGFFLIIEVIILILFRIKISDVAKLFFKVNSKKLEDSFKIEFYDDYFIRSGNVTIKEKYIDIDKCIETNTNFYMQDSKKDIIFIIEKNECCIELVNFIRTKFDNLDNRLGGNIKFKNKK